MYPDRPIVPSSLNIKDLPWQIQWSKDKCALSGKRPSAAPRQVIDIDRVSMAYYDPRITVFDDMDQCGSQCSSCGQCRDCGICVAICPETAISRAEKEGEAFEYNVDASRCIGCGFCAGACPCGIWDLVENAPLG
jgi:Fe-S-cluster-containing hydrogenase component 2